ncbi:MAG: APC family permease [Balneolaceae bacterium]|nr:APC family permease [Balneolaceae bacterium]
MSNLKNELERSIKTPGAILMGLGSIVGTGIFVSIAIATQIAGNGIMISIVIAGLLAAFNGLSSAQLAAAHPVSGGTYEYGYRFLNSYLGFTAGWMFMIAKSASAATAVLGCAGYLFYAFNFQAGKIALVFSGLAILLVMTIMVSGGIRRSNTANKVIVSVTLLGLMALVFVASFVNGLPVEPISNALVDTSGSSILYGSALMFVAYTGYGRIATLGEEVHSPRTTIPKAIILTMVVIIILYLLVSLTALSVMGAEAFGQTVEGEAAPLMFVAEALSVPVIGPVITIAAITAMLGVLLNLLLGLSRVLLGMARRQDVPHVLSTINPQTKSPVAAVLVTGVIIGLLVISGDVVFTWSFSAFTVLIYYSITNLSALMMPKELRLYPVWIPMMGLFGCLFLAFWIEPAIWISGVALIVVGLIWHTVAKRSRS